MSTTAPLVCVFVLSWFFISASAIQIIASDNTVTAPFMDDVVLAYQLQTPSVSIALTTGTSSVNEELIFHNAVDFAITASGLTALQQTLHPTVILLPFVAAAIVPVYRIDQLGKDAPPVIFTRSILAQIFLGNITRWNDPQLVAVNPAIALPNKNMTVVVEADSTAINLAFTQALCSFYTPSCSIIPASSLPPWQSSNYAAFASGSGVTGLASTVTTIDGAIGYALLAAALQVQATVGNIINRAGRVVVASSTSVTFAVAELATQTPAADGTVNLSDASGRSSWPICVMSYVLIDTQYIRDTCAVRAATVSFWLFIYQSAVVGMLAKAREYAILPNIVIAKLNIIMALTDGILCNGAAAIHSTSLQQIQITGSNRLSFFLGLIADLYTQTEKTVDYIFSSTTSQVALDRLVAGETDVAFYYESEVTSQSLADARQSGSILLIPVFVVAIVPIFNPQITANVNIGSQSVFIDYSTFIRILLQNVTSWQDPLILMRNPSLTLALVNQTAPITVATGCTSANLLTQILNWATDYATQYDVSLLHVIHTFATTTSCQDLANRQVVVNEYTIPSLVASFVGAVGYQQNDALSTDGQFGLIVQRKMNGVIQSVVTTATAQSQVACLSDTFNAQTLTANVESSQNPICWPLTSIVYAAVRTSYTNAHTDATSCSHGQLSLQLLSWLLNTNELNVAMTTQNIARSSDLTAIAIAVNRALDAVTCDGETMLITLPVIWSLADGAVGVGVALAVLGIVGVMVALLLIVLYRTHPVIKFAGIWFLIITSVGVGVIFVAIISLVLKVTPQSCAALAWTVNIGFMLTFAPLVAKTWISVVKVRGRKLALLVGCAIAADIILLSIWQSIAPLQPLTTVITSGSPTRDDEYTQCGVTSGGGVFLLIESVSKSLLLIYGAVLAFTTRRFNNSDNESQSRAWAMYNVVFSVAIVTPIVLLINATGNVRGLLLIFVLAWIAYFTAAILFASKFMAIFYGSEYPLNINSGAKSSVEGFDFVAVDNFTTTPLLRTYIKAAERHMTCAKQRFTLLTGESVDVVHIPSTLNIAAAPINNTQTQNPRPTASDSRRPSRSAHRQPMRHMRSSSLQAPPYQGSSVSENRMRSSLAQPKRAVDNNILVSNITQEATAAITVNIIK